MTLEQREKIFKAILESAYTEIPEEKQNYLLGFIEGLAQSKKIEAKGN